LIKYQRLNNTLDPIFADSWRAAIDSSIKTLLKTSTVGGHVYLADFDDTRKIRHVSSHLACFHGGNWLFGGRLLENQTIIDIGLQLVDSCWNTYASSTTGIGPERFAFTSADGGYTGGSQPSPDQLTYDAKHGFYPTSSYYVLRPEVLESNFYAWRVTGDEKYLGRAVAATESFRKYLKVPSGGYAGLIDVNDPSKGMFDDTESFWYAEVLKYLYLTFDDPAHYSLDKYVFNTEAHPLKVPPAPKEGTYGTGTAPSPGPFKTTSGKLPAVSPLSNSQ
jgi:mannosyl-oligosaccharide alpha-1,2-mannosidase